jgi:5-methyltetrahydrofolate--homocysteine methyltransferase
VTAGVLNRLRGGPILVGDGAWGTELQKKGLKPGGSPEAFGRSRPEVVAEIAGRYLDAGADLLTTNTFGASPLNLARFDLESETVPINRDAVRIVRQVAAGRAWVAASVGPSGALLEPHGSGSEAEVVGSFRRQIEALVDAGADLITIETMTDLREAQLAVGAAKAVAPDLPVLAAMSFDSTPRGFFTIMGVSVEQAAAGLEAAGADAVGSNCGEGIETMIGIAREFRRHTRLPLVIRPNAGLPEHRNGRIVYPETPGSFTVGLGDLLEAKVSVIGGCCGTGPEHVRAIRRTVDVLMDTPPPP